MLDLPASRNFGSEVEGKGPESGIGSPEKDLDLTEENLTTVGGQESGEILTEQVSDVFNASVAVDEKVGIQKETLVHSTTLDVSCILLLLFYIEGCLHSLTFFVIRWYLICFSNYLLLSLDAFDYVIFFCFSVIPYVS